MKIRITNIKVQSITNIGSLNIGKTILSQNQASSTDISTPENAQSNTQAAVLPSVQPLGLPVVQAPAPPPAPSPLPTTTNPNV